MIPFNCNARWKKMFSREYAVQYTEISLRSLSPEVKDLIRGTFYEQIYVPEENNEVCYVDEKKWNAFLSGIQKEWATRHVSEFECLFLKTGCEYISYAKRVAKRDLSKTSNEGLIRLYTTYQRLCTRYTLFIWAAYFLNDFCAERARVLIQKKLGEGNPHPYFEAVFTPLKKAAILRLTHTVSTNQRLSSKSLKRLYESYKWIPCLDIHNQPWTFSEFKAHLKDFKKKETAKNMTYTQALKDLKVNANERKLLGYANLFAYIKDLRDDFRRQGIFYIHNSLFKELAKRTGLSVGEMSYLQEREVIARLEKGTPCNKASISERKKGFVMMYDAQKKLVCASGDALKGVLANLGLQAEEKIQLLQGAAASKGVAAGPVVIVKGVKDLPSVRKGDVLVAVTTHPDYVPAMQKACAIITEEGGVTSHAAIVARELGIPCVVGTKTATKVLNRGDRVEVDGTHGTIRVLKA